MDGDYDTGLSPAVRAELEKRHPGSRVEFDEINKALGVVISLKPSGTRYVVGPTLPELVLKLGIEGSEAG